MQLGHRKIVDPMAERFIGTYSKRRLHLRQDHAEMRHNDDILPLLCCQQTIHRAGDTGRDLMPAFAARWPDIARMIPIGA